MNSDNHTHSRELQQDARAWATFTGTKYTAALRQMSSPLARGILGERISARQLIAALENHPVVGASGGGSVLGENGYRSETPWSFDGRTDYIELALIADMLRMFTAIESAEALEVGSYSLKHTAELFLSPHVSYVSNGRLIWAAAALGLRIGDPEGANPNLLVGVHEREHDYVRRMAERGRPQPRGVHYRPPGYEYLQTALSQIAAGGAFQGRWIPRPVVSEASPFHDWLLVEAEAGRNDAVGDFAYDYSAGVRASEHRIARTPVELLEILDEVPTSPKARIAAERAVAEWVRMQPLSTAASETTADPGEQPDSGDEQLPAVTSIRTERIWRSSHEVEGYGAGSGSTERYEYRCPCGDGKVVEEHDNIPGFREHDIRVLCDKCRSEWRFVDGRSVRDWALERIPVGVVG